MKPPPPQRDPDTGECRECFREMCRCCPECGRELESCGHCEMCDPHDVDGRGFAACGPANTTPMPGEEWPEKESA